MKLKFTTLNAAFLLLFAFTACDRVEKGDKATITEEQLAASATGQSYTVDTADSHVRFIGYGVGKNHPGRFKVQSGNVAVQNDRITGGNFIINIRGMEIEQKESKYQEKLRPHLLSGDFFDAEKFGTAKFEITGVQPYKPGDKDSSIVQGANFNVSGNLTIKDVTRNIAFPAFIEMDENKLKAKADFDIDRTQWRINYGNDKTLGDSFISEKVNIELDLVASKSQ
ncbi:MAG TPA: YceI family protein [Bacteroidia bacterium]|nr:YceI family protein [Bacteroidia bacterium]